MKNVTFVGAKFFLGAPRGARSTIEKNRIILIQNGGLHPQPKFEHSSTIRKCLKIGDFWGVLGPPTGSGGPI